MTIKAPDSIRQWQNNPAINSAANDYVTEQGVRVSLPCYIDVPMTKRKDVLNALRSMMAATVSSRTNTMSGLVVETASNTQSNVEAYIGMTIDVLRTVIFQRGGMEVSLILRLQEVTGIELVSPKDFTTAFKLRQDIIKSYIKEYPFNN